MRIGMAVMGTSILLTCAAHVLCAQSSVRGSVIDRIGGRAVAGATVVLLGEGRSVRTDAEGRFVFEGVSDGARGIAHWGPWLDSLGLPPLEHVFSRPVPATEIELATPSLPDYQRLVCGEPLSTDVGIVLGEVRTVDGAPSEEIVVTARWSETTLGVGSIDRRDVAVADTTGAAGTFALCFVPVDVEVIVRARGSELATGQLGVTLGRTVERLDLVVGDVARRMVVSGRVTDSLGAGTRARVEVRGDTSLSTESGDDGLFRLTAVPRRSGEVLVRAVGYVPKVASVDPAFPAHDFGRVVLSRVPPELEQVTVTADPFANERAGFEERRRGALGVFITEDMLKGIPDVSPDAIVGMVPRLRALRPRFGAKKPTLMIRRGNGFCAPRFFSDGIDEGRLIAEREGEQWSLLQRAKRIEVYTANQAPPRFNDNEGCGSIVVWTR